MTQNYSNEMCGVVLDHSTTFTMREFCRACGADRTLIVEMVTEGLIDPIDPSAEWQFHGAALVRARRAIRLLNDLGVNLPGAALAVDLLDELEQLRGANPKRGDEQ